MSNAIFNLFYNVWKHEKIPSDWQQSELIQLFKGRGSISDPNMMRHIHLKDMVCKFFSQIVIAEAKDPIYENIPSIR